MIEKEAQWGSEQLADFIEACGVEGKDTYLAVAAIFDFVKAEAVAAESRDRDLAAQARPKRAAKIVHASEEGGTRPTWQVLEETMSARFEVVRAGIPAARWETLRSRVIRSDWAPSKLYIRVTGSASDDRAWEAELGAEMARLTGQPFSVEIQAPKSIEEIRAEYASAHHRRVPRAQSPSRVRSAVDPEVFAAFVAATGAQSLPRSTEEGVNIATGAYGVTRVVAWLNQHVGIEVGDVGPQIVMDLAKAATETGGIDGVVGTTSN